MFSSIGLLTDAQVYYNEALSYVETEIDSAEWIRATIALNTCLHAQGKLSEAIDGLLPLLDRKTVSLEIIGCLHRALGNVYRSANKFHEAEMHLSKAVDIAVNMKDEAKRTEWMGELGRVYRSAGLHHKALTNQMEAYKGALHRGEIAQLASISGEIGFTNYSLKEPNHSEAIRYLSLRYFLASEVLEDTASVRWCLNNLGKVYHSMGTLDPAIECFRKSLKLVKGTGNLLGEGTALGNLGSVLRDAGLYEEAIKYHKLYLVNARERLDVGGEAIMLRELSFDYFLMEDFVNCREYAVRGLFLVEKIRGSFKASDDQLKLGNHEKNEARIFNILQLVLVKLGQFREALLVSEMSRARAVLDLMSLKQQKFEFSVHCSDIILEQSMLFDAIKVEEKCEELRSIASAMASSILVYSIIEEPVSKSQQKEKWLYMWLVNNTGIAFEKKTITNSVIDVTVEKNYFTTLKRDIGLKRKKNSSGIVKSYPLNESTKPQESSTIVSHHPLAGETAAATGNPYHYLIEPVEAHLKNIKRLVIIPHGFLYLVPFASLKNNQNCYLIENFVISYVQSFSILSLLIEATRLCCNKELVPLIIGNPSMPLQDIEQLKGAEEEAKRIRDIIGGDIMTGKNANKASVCQAIPGRSIIHFATHALLGDSINEHVRVVDEDKARVGDLTGDYSVKGAVVLAKSNDSCSGILTSSEIQTLNFSSCQLITLSCCRTACGTVSGDGVLGLSRALVVGGAKCAVSTLWAIEDEATVDLMTVFYSKYRETNDAAIALRMAMLALISDGHYKPEQWSAFCVTGVSIGMLKI